MLLIYFDVLKYLWLNFGGKVFEVCVKFRCVIFKFCCE